MHAEDEKTLAGLLLALGVVLALYLPGLSEFFAPYLLLSLFCVMVFSLLPFARLDAEHLLELHPVIVPLIFWQQFLLPTLVIIAGRLTGFDDQIVYFVVLTLTSGSLFASPTLVQLMGLDQRIAVQTVILSTLTAPFSIYAFFSFLHSGPVDLDLIEFGERLFLFLLIPIFIFLIVRITINKYSEDYKDQVDRVGRWGSVISLIIFCFALEDQVNDHLAAEFGSLLEYLVIAIVVAVSVAITTKFAMASFGSTASSTATVLASFRNVGLTFGLVGSVAGPEVAVYVGVCQIPMFCAPLFFDLFLRRSGNPKKSEKLRIDARFESMDRKFEENSTLNELNAFISILEQPSGNKKGLTMSQPNYDVGQMKHAPMLGNAALRAEPVEEQRAIPFEPASIVDPEIRNQIFQKMEDARSLLDRLEQEMNKASVKLIGRPGWYLASFLLVAIIGIAAVWQGNRYFYPMLFSDKLVAEVAETHSQGRNFAVFDLNINIRDLRYETIKRMDETPELIVLGASHWQEAHVDLLPNYKFYNSHIHRDYYEDMMAMAEMWVRNDRLPDEMIITIRDNLFTPVADRTDFLWYPGIKYYQDFAKRIGFQAHPWWETLPYQTWRELVSLPLLYSQAKVHLFASEMPHATDERNFEALDTLLPGGSILWSAEHQEIFSQERARKESLDFAAYKRENPPKIDPKGVEHMEALFDYLVGRGVKITLAHPQFNPIFWDAVQGSAYIDGLAKVEKLTQDWAEKYGFAVIGGFAPEAVGCKAEQYIDAEHGDPACLGLLLSQYDPANGRKPGNTAADRATFNLSSNQ